MSQERSEKPMNKFFSNPTVGMIGTVASVIGVLLAIYFYAESLRSRELVFMVRPTKTIVVKAGQTSRLSVFLEDKKIESDVTAIQIDFWNNGKESIHREHILRPFSIEVPKSQIIETRLIKKSREVTNIRLEEARIAEGKLGISWDILEHNDGGVVQIVFAGNPNSPISASAIVEGQPEVLRILSNRSDHLLNIVGAFSAIALGVLSLYLSFIFKLHEINRYFLALPIACVFSLLCDLCIIIYIFTADVSSPFG